MNNNSSPTRASASPSILPSQLNPAICELAEVSNLVQFLWMSLMRTQQTEEEFSLSFGESEALIGLMQTVMQRIVHVSGELSDLALDLKKGTENHE